MNLEQLIEISNGTDVNFAPYYDLLPNLINERGYKKGIEIGVYTGGHAESILSKTQLQTLVGVDPYKFYENGMPHFDTQQDYDQLKDFTLRRLLKYAPRFFLYTNESDEAFQKLIESKDKFDFVFVDGLHTYEQCKKDLDNYSQLIQPGGVVSGHDIDHSWFPGVTTAIEEFAAKHGKEIFRGPLHSWYVNW